MSNLSAVASFGGSGGLSVDMYILPWRDQVDPYRGDPLNYGISPTAGSDLIFRAATGLEKSWADVDAQRLIATYAELPRDQWDPYKITYRNLGYLAWAMGVNLWEDDWPEAFRRYWVANQWTYKYERGSLLGLKDFVHALSAGGTMQAEVIRVTRPPAIPYGLGQVANVAAAINYLVPNAVYTGTLLNTRQSYENDITWYDSRPKPSWTDLINASRAIYVSRFPQLRGYPYVGRIQLPWVCYAGVHHAADGVTRIFQKNGSFLGPLWMLFPTIQDAGGNYTYTYTLWDHGVETTLTHRTIANVDTGQTAGWGFTPGVSAYDDQVILPTDVEIDYFMGEDGKYLNSSGKFGIFAGASPPLRVVTVSRSGPLPLTAGKAQYTTILPSNQLVQLDPVRVSQRHPIRKTEWYLGPLHYLYGGYLYGGIPRSNAWQYLYDVWYLFDPSRVPDVRKAGVFMGHCRFGIPKYTAQALIKVRVKQSNYFPTTDGYLFGYCKPDTATAAINKVRRGVCASMAIRDTVLIDTTYTRPLELADIIRPDGTHKVGQLVSN